MIAGLPPARLLAAAAVGGAIGAVARYGFELVFPFTPGQWPIGTFVVNVAGAFLLGLLTGELMRRERAGVVLPDWLRPLLITGVLGGFTTFSTWMFEAASLLATPGAALLGAAYLVASLLSGVLALLVGLRLVGDRGAAAAVEADLAGAEDA